MPFKFAPSGRASGPAPLIRKHQTESGLTDENKVTLKGARKSKSKKSGQGASKLLDNLRKNAAKFEDSRRKQQQKKKDKLSRTDKKKRKSSSQGDSDFVFNAPEDNDSFPDLPNLNEDERLARTAARSELPRDLYRAPPPVRALPVPSSVGSSEGGDFSGSEEDDDFDDEGQSLASLNKGRYDESSDGEESEDDFSDDDSRSVATSISQASSLPLDPMLARMRQRQEASSASSVKRNDSRARAADAPAGMNDKDLEEAERRDLLVRLSALKQKGVQLSKNFTPRTPLHELRIEMGRLELMRQTEQTVTRLRRYLLVFVSGLQQLVDAPFMPKKVRGRLNGFSEHVLSDISSYDPVFERMAEVYGTKIGIGTTGYPIIDIFFTLGTQLAFWVLIQSRAGNAPPTEDEIIKNHPDLVRRAARRILREGGGGNFGQDAPSVNPASTGGAKPAAVPRSAFQPRVTPPAPPPRPLAPPHKRPFESAERVLADLGLPSLNAGSPHSRFGLDTRSVMESAAAGASASPARPEVLPGPPPFNANRRVEFEATGKALGMLKVDQPQEEPSESNKKNVVKIA